MKDTKHIYTLYYLFGIVIIFIAGFSSKDYLIYIKPLSILIIFAIYLLEKKRRVDFLYISTLLISIVGEVFILLSFKSYFGIICSLYAVFNMLMTVLLYRENYKHNYKISKTVYMRLALIVLPLFYMFYIVIDLIHIEITKFYISFTFLVTSLSLYMITSLYYYLMRRSNANLWMLIAVVNIIFTNIIIVINELFIYEAIFTLMINFCILVGQFSILLFMIEKEKDSNTIDFDISN